jgi:hypothetical protein
MPHILLKVVKTSFKIHDPFQWLSQKFGNLAVKFIEIMAWHIDIKRKNRLLKVCYVPTTSATFLAFLLFFMLWPLAVLKKPKRQAVSAVKKSILLRCLWMYARRYSGRDKKAARFYNSDFYNTF